MESDSDIQSTFSTLNVNAVEFVPSFGPSFAATTAQDPETAIEESAKPVVEMTENNGNGESYANVIDVFEGRKFLPHRKL